MNDEEEIEAARLAERERCQVLRNEFPREFADEAIVRGWTVERARREFNQSVNVPS